MAGRGRYYYQGVSLWESQMAHKIGLTPSFKSLLLSPRISQNPYILQPTLDVVPGQGDAMSVIPIRIFPKKFANQKYFNLFSSSKYLENRQSQ